MLKSIKLLFSISLIAIIISFSACQKNDLTVTLKTAGTLTVQITDSTAKNYSNIKVHLFAYYDVSSLSPVYEGELDVKTTDSKGNVDFGSLESGTYYVVTDTVKIGTKTYMPAKPIQVISGSSKSLSINPQEYIGTVKVAVSIYTNEVTNDTAKWKYLKVVLVKANDAIFGANRKYVISKAVGIKNCDVNGKVEFDNVPSDITYTTYVYINNSDTIGGWAENGDFSFTKGSIYSITSEVMLSDLYTPRVSLALTFQYYSYYSGSYLPVKNTNAVLINYNDYLSHNLYGANQSTIISYKFASGTTDNNGVVTFKNIPEYNDYYVYVYKSNTLYTWSSEVYPPNSPVTIDVNGSSLGLTK